MPQKLTPEQGIFGNVEDENTGEEDDNREEERIRGRRSGERAKKKRGETKECEA